MLWGFDAYLTKGHAHISSQERLSARGGFPVLTNPSVADGQLQTEQVVSPSRSAARTLVCA